MDPEFSRLEVEQLNAMRSSVVAQLLKRQLQLIAQMKTLSEDWTRDGPHKILATRAVSRKIDHIAELNKELVALVKSESESSRIFTAEIHRAMETSPAAVREVLQKSRDVNLRFPSEQAPRREELLDVLENEIEELGALMSRYR
jgi:hypothetical protein